MEINDTSSSTHRNIILATLFHRKHGKILSFLILLKKRFVFTAVLVWSYVTVSQSGVFWLKMFFFKIIILIVALAML